MTGFRADFRNAGLIENPCRTRSPLKIQSPISNSGQTSAVPDKFTDKPVHVLTRHLTLDIPSETADVLGELQRNPEPLPELPDRSGPSFPEPTGQAH